MGYHEIPAYLRRDLRRLYGPHRLISADWHLQELLVAIESTLAANLAAIIESWCWRDATGFGAQKALAIFRDRFACGGTYRRRGDLLVLFKEN